MKNLKLLPLIFFMITISCEQEHKSKKELNKDLSVDLKSVINEKFEFDRLSYLDFPLVSYSKKYPKYYKDKIKQIKGIPKLDSFQIVSFNTQRLPFNYHLYKKGDFDKEKFYKRFHKKLDDTINLSNTFYKTEINAISGFLNDKQIVIVDTNNNLDFNDDEVNVYPINFRNTHNGDIQKMTEIDTLSINYQYYKPNTVTNIEKKATIYPYTNSVFEYMMNMGIIDERLNNYTLVMNLKDYFYGKLPFDDNENYNISIQGLNRELAIVYVMPSSSDSTLYKDLTFLKNFAYQVGDTINFSKNQFELNFDDDMLRIQLSGVKNNTNKYGYRIGDNIGNHKINNLQGEVFELKKMIKEKRLTLLEFWGTWCVPCKKVMPRIKQIHSLYKDELTILGIALDKEKKDVLNYTKKNNMTWSHFFVDLNNRANSIIKNMNIGSYPTFVLVDKKGKILFRGGSGSLDYIEKIIRNQ